MSDTKKMTRKEKIEAGVEKAPKRKRAYAEKLAAERQDEVKAVLRNSPISARKMRMLIDLIRGEDVESALNMLKFSTRAGSVEVQKLIRSALANWEEKFEDQRVELSNLYIKEAFSDSARMLKRYRPAPQGRAHRIRKRSNHVTLILGAREEE